MPDIDLPAMLDLVPPLNAAVNLGLESILESAKPAHSPEPAQSASEPNPPQAGAALTLEINHGHFYMAGHMGILEFRLRNHTADALTQGRLAVSAKGLGEIEESRFECAAQGTEFAQVQIDPGRSGEHLLRITVETQSTAQAHTYRGSVTLGVLAPEAKPSTIIFDQRMQAGGNIGYGMLVDNQVREDFHKGLIKSVNDLIQRQYPASWRPLKLNLVETRDLHPLRLLPAMPDRKLLTNRGALFWGDAEYRGDDRPRALLLAKPDVRLGRKRDNSDIVLRRLPRSEDNDRRTLLIAGQSPHCIISLREDGLFVSDQNTTNGTRLNGTRIQGRAKVPLDDVSELNLANALQLRLTPFCCESEDAPTLKPYTDLLGPTDSMWRTAAGLCLRSLLVERVDNQADQERYLLVYRWAEFGPRPQCELNSPASERGLRLLRLGGCLWLERRQHPGRDGGAYRLQLAPGNILKLQQGVTVPGALESLMFDEYGQIGL